MAEITEDQLRDATEIDESQLRDEVPRGSRVSALSGPGATDPSPSGALSTYSHGVMSPPVVTEESPSEFSVRVTPNPDEDAVGRFYVNSQALRLPLGLLARGIGFAGGKALSAAETAASQGATAFRLPSLSGSGVAAAIGSGVGGLKGAATALGAETLRQNALPMAYKAAPLVRGVLGQSVLTTPRAAALMSGIPNIFSVSQ